VRRWGRTARGVLDEIGDQLAAGVVVEGRQTDAAEAVVEVVRNPGPAHTVEAVDEADPRLRRHRTFRRGDPPLGCAGQQVGLFLAEVLRGGAVVGLGVLVVMTDEHGATVADMVQIHPVPAAVVEVPHRAGGVAGIGPASRGADGRERGPASTHLDRGREIDRREQDDLQSERRAHDHRSGDHGGGRPRPPDGLG
jgi:hypothetical protein